MKNLCVLENTEVSIYFPSTASLTSFNISPPSHLTNSSNNLIPPDDKPSGYSYEVR